MFASRAALLVSALLVSASALSADILVGSKREEVIAELGKPTSAARRGTREILLYPKGVRLELEGNEVADIKGYIPKTVPTSTNTPAKSASASAAPPPAPAPASASPSVSAAARPPAGSPGVTPAAAAAPTVESESEEEPEASEPEQSLGVAIGIAAVMLSAQFLLTFIALKIAFHYHQMDALWSGIFAITAIDVALQTLFAVFLYFQSGEVRLGIAGTGLPGLAMIWSVRRFCLDQRWNRAVATTSAVKTAAILLNLGLLALLARFA